MHGYFTCFSLKKVAVCYAGYYFQFYSLCVQKEVCQTIFTELCKLLTLIQLWKVCELLCAHYCNIVDLTKVNNCLAREIITRYY